MGARRVEALGSIHDSAVPASAGISTGSTFGELLAGRTTPIPSVELAEFKTHQQTNAADQQGVVSENGLQSTLRKLPGGRKPPGLTGNCRPTADIHYPELVAANQSLARRAWRIAHL